MKRVFLILVVLFLAAGAFAQAPEKMSYQAVVRGADGALIKNSKVGIRISIIQDAGHSTVVYKELQSVSTNANGLLSLKIGDGYVLSGTFEDINWASGAYSIQTEIDPAGGYDYRIVSTSQLLSVPYALFANSAGNNFSGDYKDLVNRPDAEANAIPRIASPGQRLSVSFSGGDDIYFTQSSPSCPGLAPEVKLVLNYEQGSPTMGSSTVIYPDDIYFINSRRFDAVFDIPSFISAGMYDIVIGSNACPYVMESSFKIY